MNVMKLAVPLFVALAYGPAPGWAAPIIAPILGPNLATFAVLGSETVTNVPPSTIVGNVGVSPGTGTPGFCTSLPGTACPDLLQVTGGLVHHATGVAASAQAELTTARNNLSGLGVGTTLPSDLVGLTIFPGVFTVPFNAVSNLSGAVTLDGLGDANAFWLFQTGALTTSSASVVNVIHTGIGAGVFWNDTSSVTLGSTTSFEGNILALASVGLVTGATIGCGRALADVGEVTLQQNTIGIGCGFDTGAGSNGFSGSGLEFLAGPGPGPGSVHVIVPGQPPGTGPIASVPGQFIPEPGTLLLFSLGLAGLFAFRKKAIAVA